ncbi:hypothetical protein GUJ93_ZPchr0012g21483 [Zizania palustris]|uniref:Uncharacterized protein n=1 Tax=Zizania palustris TaxID=103762 RepID=A0A8J5WUP1_ZIZPA|nr:hypothetical protein GUJ93_ZPchr0012g21483 [Zizania palustris]
MVLLELDRIEQDDELTYEQFLVLETNLLLSGLGQHDQRRYMRIDIDNRNYCTIEERIGSVGTALSDEQFANYVNRSVYKPPNSDLEVNRTVVDYVKCRMSVNYFLVLLEFPIDTD